MWLNPYGFISASSPNPSCSSSSMTMMNTSSSSSQDSYACGTRCDMDMIQPGGWLVNFSARSVSASPISSTHSKSSTIKAESRDSNDEITDDAGSRRELRQGGGGGGGSGGTGEVPMGAPVHLGDSSSPYSSFSSGSSSHQMLSSLSSSTSAMSISQSLVSSSASSHSMSSNTGCVGAPEVMNDISRGTPIAGNKGRGASNTKASPAITSANMNPAQNLYKGPSSSSPLRKVASDCVKLISPLQSPRRRMGISLSSLPSPSAQHIPGDSKKQQQQPHQQQKHKSPSKKKHASPSAPTSSALNTTLSASSPNVAPNSFQRSPSCSSPAAFSGHGLSGTPGQMVSSPASQCPTNGAAPKLDPPPKYQRSTRPIERWERGSWYGAPLTANTVENQRSGPPPPVSSKVSSAPMERETFPAYASCNNVGKVPTNSHHTYNNISNGFSNYGGSSGVCAGSGNIVVSSPVDNNSCGVILRPNSRNSACQSYRYSDCSARSSTSSYTGGESCSSSNLSTVSSSPSLMLQNMDVRVNDLNSSGHHPHPHNSPRYHIQRSNSNSSGITVANGPYENKNISPRKQQLIQQQKQQHHHHQQQQQHQLQHQQQQQQGCKRQENNQLHRQDSQHRQHQNRQLKTQSQHHQSQQQQAQQHQHQQHHQQPHEQQQQPPAGTPEKWQIRMNYGNHKSPVPTNNGNTEARETNRVQSLRS